MSETTFMGVERDKIDWSPRIDFDVCNYCMECVDFCPHQVFEEFKDEKTGERRFIIKNPDNCVVFCRACSKTCGLDCMSFPNKAETTKRIKQLRKEAGND